MKTLIAIAAAALLASTGVAQAQIGSEPASVAVSYADLDLSSPGGRKALEGRVAAAVKRVCPEKPLPQELRKQQAWRACQHTAWSSARQQLAAIYGGSRLAANAVQVNGTN